MESYCREGQDYQFQRHEKTLNFIIAQVVNGSLCWVIGFRLFARYSSGWPPRHRPPISAVNIGRHATRKRTSKLKRREKYPHPKYKKGVL